MGWGDEIIEDFEQDLIDIIGDYGTEQVKSLNSVNPLKSGLSRSNWQLSLRPNENVVRVFQPQQTVALAKINSKQIKLDKPFYIYNNTPYIVPLLDGSSPQRSSGWLDRSILDVLNKKFGS